MGPVDGLRVIYVATRGSYGSRGWTLGDLCCHNGELWPQGDLCDHQGKLWPQGDLRGHQGELWVPWMASG